MPEAIFYRPKWRIALDEIDRALASGARFGCVLADTEYGKVAEFRAGLGQRQLAYAVGILPTQKVYPVDVTLSYPAPKATGRPRKHPLPSVASVAAAELIEAQPEAFRTISWRTGTMIGRADHPFPQGRGPAAREGARSRPRSPRSGCAWPTGRSQHGHSTCPARRLGSSVSTAPRASGNTT